jgi:cytoskeletal protein CcmA (bactofilin family)
MMKPAALALLLLVLAVPFAKATDFLTAEHYRLDRTRTVTNELWLQARTIVVAGTAQDDLFLLADGSAAMTTNGTPPLLLSGDMQADVWAAGESIVVSGSIARHGRFIGFKTVGIDGPVKRNLMALGGTVSVGEKGEVSGDAVLVARDVLVNGIIHGTTRIYGSQATLAGQFGGDVTITAGDINVMPGTRIAGNLNYLMEKDLILDSRVTIEGKLIKMTPQAVVPASPWSMNTILWQMGLCLGALLVGMAFVSFFPGVAAISLIKLSESFWRCVLMGFIAFCLIPMAAFFLIFTIIGLPLSLIMAMIYLIVIYVGKIIAAMYLGQLLLRNSQAASAGSALPRLLLGLLVVYAGFCLPFPIDILLWFAFTLMGLGGLMSCVLDRRLPVMVGSLPAGKPPPLP